MRAAMAAAPVGDDQFGEDPTVNALQERVAALLGKEAALWVPSGTMANQVALRVLTRPGDTVLVSRAEPRRMVRDGRRRRQRRRAVHRNRRAAACSPPATCWRHACRRATSSRRRRRSSRSRTPTTGRGRRVSAGRGGARVRCRARARHGVVSRRRATVECRSGDRRARRHAGGAVRSRVGGVLEGAWCAGRLDAGRVARDIAQACGTGGSSAAPCGRWASSRPRPSYALDHHGGQLADRSRQRGACWRGGWRRARVSSSISPPSRRTSWSFA